MSTLVRPFAGLRPRARHAAAVAAPPYDVLDTEEARARAEGKPMSFLHISKPEIDLPPGTDPYAPEVYEKGAENLERLTREGVLVRDDRPCYYIYRFRIGDHVRDRASVDSPERGATRTVPPPTLPVPGRCQQSVDHALKRPW